LSADISTDNDNMETRALADDIAAFISRKRPFPFYSPMRFSIYPLISLYILTFIVGGIGAYQKIALNKGLSYVILSLVFLAGDFIMTFFTLRQSYTLGSIRIVPARRAESHRLSGRTRRDIAIAVIASILGAVIIALAGLWAGLFAK
jgi:hypothetical protein